MNEGIEAETTHNVLPTICNSTYEGHKQSVLLWDEEYKRKRCPFRNVSFKNKKQQDPNDE